MAQESQEFRLTFGIELEFLLGSVADGISDPHPSDPRTTNLLDMRDLYLDIVNTLRSAGVPAWGMYSASISEEEKSKCWILDDDVSLYEYNDTDGEGYRYDGMELQSPPYYYCESSISTIAVVINALKRKYRIKVNNSTGLHVHVGNQFNALQIRQLRNLMALAITYEKPLALIHPTRRDESMYCGPLIGSPIGQTHGRPRRQFLDHVLGVEDYDQLVTGVTSARGLRLGFNIENLRMPYRSGKRTIEFRHHEGSLDPVAITNWLRVCVSLVETALLVKEEEQEEFNAQLRHDCELPIGNGANHLSTIKVLMKLRCPVQAYYYGVLIQKRGAAEVQQRIDRIETLFG